MKTLTDRGVDDQNGNRTEYSRVNSDNGRIFFRWDEQHRRPKDLYTYVTPACLGIIDSHVMMGN